ncbi:MAG TPA: wax ester/triacylglycerol synthase family O-acyltransferase [Solimonas sp.]|nr:wax ester/triacylglycerol synthase family O-acyltransferase [Solimonas sp.]
MQQLSGLDTVFLNLETNAVPMHVGGLAILDPSTAGPGFGFESLKRLIESRLHLLPMFRRRLLTTPLDLDQPYWIEDPDFEIENHVRHRGLPHPGTPQQLADFICDVIATRLDRSMPLWRVYFVEGLEGGKVAMVSKVHHACIDGVSGAELFTTLLDLQPQPRRVAPPDTPWMPDEMPPPWRLGYIAGKNLISRPGNIVRLVRETAPFVLNMGKTAWAQRKAARQARADDVEPAEKTGGTAPRMRFNNTITSRRAYAFRTLSLPDIKFVKNAYGVSVNDVVLCICAGGLREYLLEKKELPRQPLIAAIPMSVRTEAEKGSGGNKVTMARTQLATDVADPVERLHALSRKMGKVKSSMKAIPAKLMLDWAHAPPPAVMAQAARLYENFSIQDLMSPPYNLVISNVPGPPVPLYLNGARVEANYPISIPYHGLACNITVMSYQSNLDFGITAHRGTVPDIERMMDLIAAELETLKERAQQQLRKAG